MSTMPSNMLVKVVYNLAAVEFQNIGWTKRRHNVFSKMISQHAYGCVALNKSMDRSDGTLHINPVVSVGDLEVERQIAELTAQVFHPFMTAAVGSNVGYLMPARRYTEWQFGDGDNHRYKVGDMIATIQTFSQPFFQQNATLSSLYETLLMSKRGAVPDPLDYRIAVASKLLGKQNESIAFVEARANEIVDRVDEAAEWFRRFAARLRES